MDPTSSRTGLRVKYNTLAKGRADAARPGNTRTVKVQTTVVEPKVSTKHLAKKYPAVLIVNRGAFKLKLYKDLKPSQDVRHRGRPGRAGDARPGSTTSRTRRWNPAWHVPNSDWAGDLGRQGDPRRRPANPIKARWMGIYDGAGVHGTADDGSIGSAASHGCIRMHIPDVDGALRPGAGRRARLHRVDARWRRRDAGTPPWMSAGAPPANPAARGRHGGRSGE